MRAPPRSRTGVWDSWRRRRRGRRRSRLGTCSRAFEIRLVSSRAIETSPSGSRAPHQQGGHGQPAQIVASHACTMTESTRREQRERRHQYASFCRVNRCGDRVPARCHNQVDQLRVVGNRHPLAHEARKLENGLRAGWHQPSQQLSHSRRRDKPVRQRTPSLRLINRRSAIELDHSARHDPGLVRRQEGCDICHLL